MTHLPALSIWVVALADDSARLAATLEMMPAALRESVTVLSVSCDDSDFWTSVIPQLEGDHPCFVIRAGTLLPPHWVGRLLPALTPEAAAVFPLSVRHPATTVFSDHQHQPGLPVQEIDQWLNDYVPGRVFDLPTLAAHAALIQPLRFREALATRDIHNDAELAQALLETGSSLLASDALYLDDSALPPLTWPLNLYEAWLHANQRHPLTAMRHALTELSARSEHPPVDKPSAQPVCLHICHGWGGGLWRWVEDAMEADNGERHLVLRPVGDWNAFCQTLILSDSLHGAPLASWTLVRPILSTAISHYEYQQILSRIIAEYGVSRLMISSVIGHSLQVLETGLPTVIVCHDFYPLCPPILANWNSPCNNCNDERMQQCLAHNPEHRFFKHEPYSHWQALRQAYLERVQQRAIPMVAPTPSVIERLKALAPALRDHDFSVIPHGLPATLAESLAAARQQHSPGTRLRIVILGGAGGHKGGKLLLESIKEITGFADLLLLGFGDACDNFQGMQAVTCVPRYQRDDLGKLLQDYVPDLGLLLSTVSETFSYTLSELQAAAIPVAATRLGAFVDRIAPDEDGWLFEPDSSALVALLQALHADPARITAARQQLLQRQPRDAVEMMGDYESLLGARGTIMPVYRPGKMAGQRSDAVFTRDAIYISPDATYRDAWRGFLSYTASKIRGTQRLPAFIQRLLIKIFKG